MTSSETEKPCRVCGSTENAKPKRRAVCKPCINTQKREWMTINREEQLAKRRAYRIDNGEKLRGQARARRAASPEKLREQSRERYTFNPEKYRAEGRVKYWSDPDKHHARTRRGWRRLQSESQRHADRSGFEWAGWELELLDDRRRSIAELAFTLRRTYAAVATMRHQLDSDPQTIERAGLKQA